MAVRLRPLRHEDNANSLDLTEFVQPQWWLPEVDGAPRLQALSALKCYLIHFSGSPEVSVGDHEFLEVLGEGLCLIIICSCLAGSHGRVYKVADQLCGCFHAVKVMRRWTFA